MKATDLILVVVVLGAVGVGGYFLVKKMGTAQKPTQTQPTGFNALLTGFGQALGSGDFFGSGYNSGGGPFTAQTSYYGA